MSEVTRYFTSGTLPSCPATRKLYSCATDYVLASDYDTALSQLAALREELANRTDRVAELAQQRNDLQQRLADAERRNAELEVFERFAGYLLDHCEGETIYEESLQHWLSESIKLYKPTESGASAAPAKPKCHWSCTGCDICGSAGHGSSWS